MRVLAILVAGVCTVCCSVPPASPSPHPRPNIVVILADDLGYGDVHAFDPSGRVPTPQIDRLAAEGMRFTDAHAPGAWCVPSRYGLLTGRYPCRVGTFHPNREAILEPGQTTLASFLSAQGYATGMVGKWHLGFDGGVEPDGRPMHGGPVDRGFDTYFGIHASLDIPPYYFIRGREPVALPTGQVDASHTAGWTDIQGAFWRAGAIAPGFAHADVLPRFEAEAVAFLDARAAEPATPFFLYLALAAPHTPWLPDADHRGRSGADLYGDFVAQVDATVGAVLAALDRNGQRDDTFVVFTSDNGPVWYPADVERFGHAAAGPFRGMKSDAWEGGHRMPFVVRWPGRAPPSSVSPNTVCFTDVLATVADVLGVPLPEGEVFDTESFLPALVDPSAPPARTTTVLKADASVIRRGRFKLITHLGSGGFSKPRRVEPEPDGPQGQLYDLDADPGETRNLWLDRPEIVDDLLLELAAYRELAAPRPERGD